MGENVEQCRNHTGLRRNADAQVHIPNLGGGGIGQHPENVVFLNGPDGTEDHAADAEYKQHILHSAAIENLRAKAGEDHLQQKENVALGHQAGKNARRAGGGVAVGIRHPVVEGEQAAFDGQAHGDQADGGAEGDLVSPGPGQLRHGLMEAGQQQMAGDVIQDGHTQQEQAGADQAENHVPHRSQGGSADLADHQNAAGGQGADLNEYIAGENIVGIHQHQQSGLNQVRHDIVKLALAGLQILRQLDFGTHHAQEHHQREDEGEETL